MNDAISKGESQEVIDELYQASSKLSSLSQIEIDKSKKIFDNVNMANELSKIRGLKYLKYVRENDKYGSMSNKMIVPNFFSMVSKANDYRVFQRFNTPMDILQDVLVFDISTYQKGEKSKEFVELLVGNQEFDGKPSANSIKAIYNIISKCGKKINGLKLKTNILNEKAKQTVERKTKHDAVNKLKKLKPSTITILYILKQCFVNNGDEFDFSKYGMLTLSLLFMAKKLDVLKCFQNKDNCNEELLIRIKEGYDYDIFGSKYQKIARNELYNFEIGGNDKNSTAVM
jgi:hypothetical protein